jgi:hypothetical protein
MGLKWSSEVVLGVMVMDIGVPVLDSAKTAPKQEEVMYVFMYVCMYLCMYVCMYVYV